MRTRLAVCLALLLLSTAAPSFAVFKCQANGRTTYSDTPCPTGQVSPIEVPAAADSGEARRQLARDKAEARRLEDTRHKEEAHDTRKRRAAVRAQDAREKKCAQLARRKRWAEEDAASAGLKSTEKMKRKAQRADETYRLECAA